MADSGISTALQPKVTRKRSPAILIHPDDAGGSKSVVSEANVLPVSPLRLRQDAPGNMSEHSLRPEPTVSLITNGKSRPASSSSQEGSSSLERPKNPRLPSYHYQPRMSALDRHRLHIQQDPFRGFFTLFWIMMAVYVLLTFLHNIENHGVLLTGKLWSLFTIGIGNLLISDVFMVLGMFPIFFWEKYIVSKGWIPWRWLELLCQHVYQAAFLFISLAHCIEMYAVHVLST